MLWRRGSVEFQDKGKSFCLNSGDMGGKTFDEDSLAPLMLQLVNAVQHVHGKGAIHQDIKPRNMFLKDTRRKHTGCLVGLPARDMRPPVI